MKSFLQSLCLILTPCIICFSCSPSAREKAESFNDDGIKKDQSGDYAGAVADFNKAIELYPKFIEAYNNRGAAKSDLEDYEGAIADYARAIEIADYRKAIELNPDDVIARRNLERTETALNSLKNQQ